MSEEDYQSAKPVTINCHDRSMTSANIKLAIIHALHTGLSKAENVERIYKAVEQYLK